MRNWLALHNQWEVEPRLLEHVHDGILGAIEFPCELLNSWGAPDILLDGVPRE